MTSRRILAALLVLLGAAGAAAAQQSGGDLRRRTIAVTYPDKGSFRLVLAGTTRTPRFNGGATVKRMRGLTQVEIELDDMAPAYQLGADYTTYVMWAITPQGITDNLGEFRLNGSRSKLRATTPHETFALVVTAEPHFAVSQPSTLIVLENVPPKGPGVIVQTADVFFKMGDERYSTRDTLPDVVQKDWARQPLELLGARRAVEIAKLAGADRYAKRDFDEATKNFSQSEAAYQAGDLANAALFGREAIRHAVLAADLAEERKATEAKRIETLNTARRIEESERARQDLLDQIDDLKTQLRVSEGGRQRAEEEAERLHEEVANLRVQNRTYENEITKLNNDVREARTTLEQKEQQHEAEQVANQRLIAYQGLSDKLKPLAAVVPDSRGFKVIIPDSYFDPLKATLRTTASAKLSPIAALLTAHPGVEFLIEGYTDDKIAPEAGLQLSEERGRAVGDFLATYGIEANRFRVTGYGSANPLTTNKTLKGRATNRRVELIFLRP